jgi:NADPH-dependent glutamate synthase beta subunit-like oxidoreductase
VLLAMGFTGPEQGGVVEQLGVELDGRGNILRDRDYMSSVPGVFVAGDAGRGQSLIVWALPRGARPRRASTPTCPAPPRCRRHPADRAARSPS